METAARGQGTGQREEHGQTPLVTAPSRNRGSWLGEALGRRGEQRGPGEGQGQAAPVSSAADTGLHCAGNREPRRNPGPGLDCGCSLKWSGGREACDGAEASGRRLGSRAWRRARSPGCWAGGPVPGQGQSPRLRPLTPGRRRPHPGGFGGAFSSTPEGRQHGEGGKRGPRHRRVGVHPTSQG